jgi:hypothetical protein
MSKPPNWKNDGVICVIPSDELQYILTQNWILERHVKRNETDIELLGHRMDLIKSELLGLITRLVSDGCDTTILNDIIGIYQKVYA